MYYHNEFITKDIPRDSGLILEVLSKIVKLEPIPNGLNQVISKLKMLKNNL